MRNAIGEEVEVLTEFKKLMRYLGLEHVPQYHRYQSMAILKSLCKGEQFYSENNKSDYIYFLLSGVLRGYTIEQDGKDITDCFLFRYGQAHIGFLNTGENGFLTERAERMHPSCALRLRHCLPKFITRLNCQDYTVQS